MKKIIIATDSFKGTLTALEATKIIAEEFEKTLDNKIMQMPIADGGEGTIDVIEKYCGGKRVTGEYTGLTGEKVTASYLMVDEKTAFIESAQTIGLTLVKGENKVEKFTTFGVGEQILHAIKNGAKKIFIALGGSGTNDFGCGLACALGVKFFNAEGDEFLPVGINLCEVKKIDLTNCLKNISGCEIFGLCDIENPPCGTNGASYIYAPQKGANKDTCDLLEEGVKHLSALFLKHFNKDCFSLKGGGAAGAVGAGIFCFCNGKLISGIDYVLNTIGFNDLIDECELVVTGEGCTDAQSVNGKLISGIANIARQKGMPVIVISGKTEGELSELYKIGITKIFATTNCSAKIDSTSAISNLRSCSRRVALLIKNDVI